MGWGGAREGMHFSQSKNVLLLNSNGILEQMRPKRLDKNQLTGIDHKNNPLSEC